MRGGTDSEPGSDGRVFRRVHGYRGGEIDLSAWPATVPAVTQILSGGLELPAGVTVLIGENGSGKSTVIEILAETCGLNPQGGSAKARYQTRGSEPGIGQHLWAERGPGYPAWAYFLRADTTACTPTSRRTRAAGPNGSTSSATARDSWRSCAPGSTRPGST